MSMISVKTKEGRVAFDGPKGEQIPNNRYKLVVNTSWIQRLINVHGDIEVEPDTSKAEVNDTAPVTVDTAAAKLNAPNADVAAKVVAKQNEQSGKSEAVTTK
jgi:hypothetical protein